MKQSTKILCIVLGAFVLLGVGSCSFYFGTYNKIITLDENVKESWSQVENQYQRRFDLVPNLVATVKGFAQHESDVLTSVTEARSRAGGVMNVSDEVLNNPESFKKFQSAQSELSGALQRLLVVSEQYPELKSDQNFLALQDQLEGTENRLSVERKRFNEKVRLYNKYIRTFPKSVVAHMNSFVQKAYFEAAAGSEQAPEVSF